MADTITTSKQLTVQIETKTNATTSETKKVNIILPNPQTELTETQIKTAIQSFINAGTYDGNNQSTYIYIDSTTGDEYSFGDSDFDSNTQILTAYTTAETINVLDIGVED